MSTDVGDRKLNESYDACRRVFVLTSLLKPRCKYACEKYDKVSAWSVGQHIEHTLAVNAKAVLILSSDRFATDPGKVVPASERVLNMLESGIIPRGVAKAPESVLPKMTNFVDLSDDVERNTNLVEGLTVIHRQIASDDELYAHPSLGGLTKMQWLRFLEIHIEHHQKIIADIIGHHAI
ncbi:MAG: DUF1569 domain-containing protein [Planctomycetota bacterium]